MFVREAGTSIEDELITELKIRRRKLLPLSLSRFHCRTSVMSSCESALRERVRALFIVTIKGIYRSVTKIIYKLCRESTIEGVCYQQNCS